MSEKMVREHKIQAVICALAHYAIEGKWPETDTVEVKTLDWMPETKWLEGTFYTPVTQNGGLAKSEPIYAMIDDDGGIILTDKNFDFIID